MAGNRAGPERVGDSCKPDRLLHRVLVPLMIFAAFLVSGLVGPLERLARRSERLGRLLDSAIEKGPREGWSGYILAAVTVAFLFGIALWVFCRISGS